MTPLELFKAGKLDDAIGALNEELRRNPTDSKRRTFLFELLCFSGNYERAGKQLDVLAQGGQQSEMGALVYRGLLHATKTRQEIYLERSPSNNPETNGSVTGLLNDVPFGSLSDADRKIGANLEVFAAGAYLLIPFSLIQSVRMEPPRRLRDLLWIPAIIRTAAAYQGKELGETLLPALSPFSATHPSDLVRLGRETSWETTESGEAVPVGQKMWIMDGEEIPILEVRKLEFGTATPAS